MKKFYAVVAAIGLVAAAATFSLAGSTYSTDAGAVMTVPTGNVAGAGVLQFKPSPKVSMTGMSTDIGFAHDAVHDAALGVSGGQEYGMAADTNKVFFQMVEETGDTLYVIATSNSTFATAGGFTQMQ
ncbi:MAG: hypothetical protein C4563_08330 [Desulfobulbus sp.]|nr:MAG: hypothetical protein C4563_08330 [Desulfobulbus sp.]